MPHPSLIDEIDTVLRGDVGELREASAQIRGALVALDARIAALSSHVSALSSGLYVARQQATPCAHDDPRERRTLGVCASTAGRDQYAMEQCTLCGDPFVVAVISPNGGARSVGGRVGQFQLQRVG